MLINTEGIVLRQSKIAYNRRIIYFTRRYGKITAGTSINERAKGRRRLLSKSLHAEYDIFKGRNYFNINNLDVKKSYYSQSARI